MNDKREKIMAFVGEAVRSQDYQLLDLLFTFAWSLPSKSGYTKNLSMFKKWLGKIANRNLKQKYGSQTNVRARMNRLVEFLNSVPDFLEYNQYYEDRALLTQILKELAYESIMEDTKKRLTTSSGIEREVALFTLNYIPIKVDEWLRKAKEEDGYEYASLPDGFRVVYNQDSQRISYYNINTEKWTYAFNSIFDRELKKHTFTVKSRTRMPAIFARFAPEETKEYTFWQFGDELVKVGLGYWLFGISGKGNVSIEFIIPSFIYESVKEYRDSLGEIPDFAQRIKEIDYPREAERQESEWNIEDITEEEKATEFEIERSIRSNPEIIEEGLELVRNQYPTSVGPIDILCRDKKGGFVVLELKRGKSSDRTVGQIQRYMVWVEENLAGDNTVRGIIVAKEADNQMIYSTRGSRYPIEIKTFGDVTPIEENIRYCEKCGKPNRKDAKYCSKCGEEFWM